VKRAAAVAFLFLAACGGPKYKLVEEGTPAPQTAAKQARPEASESDPSTPKPQESDVQYKELDFRVLRGLNTRTGEISPSLKKLEGGAVAIKGYMVPFQDEYEAVTEFLLVPEAGMCVHVPAPPANQIVLVEMTSGAARVNWAKPVIVKGILEIAQSDSPYGKVAFKVEAASAAEDTSD
jgi:uncharacterized protein